MTPVSETLADGVYRPAAEAEAQRVVESWGSLNWLVSQESTHTPDLTVGRVVIKTGRCNPKHSHPNCAEALYLLRGTLRQVIGDDTVLMQAGDITVVSAGVPHAAFSVGVEDAEMIVAYPTGQRQFRAEA